MCGAVSNLLLGSLKQKFVIQFVMIEIDLHLGTVSFFFLCHSIMFTIYF
jgi:hypothetical protein